MKQFLLVMLLLFSSTSFAGEQPKTYIGIDGKKHQYKIPTTSLYCECVECECRPACKCGKQLYPSKTKQAELDRIVKEIESRPAAPKPVVIKGPRLWVQDVYQDGLWYYGYYASVDGVYEFRYSRKEYKGALTNFRSLYSVYHKYEIKNSNQKQVKVIYEPAY